MRYRIFLAPIAALALGTTTAVAQDPPKKQQYEEQQQTTYLERRMDALLKDITLTEEQQMQVDSIKARYEPQLRALAQVTKPDSTTLEKLRPVLMKQETEIRAALTTEQQKVWDKNMEELRKRDVS